MDVDQPVASSSKQEEDCVEASSSTAPTTPNGPLVPVKRGRGRPPKPKPPVDPNAVIIPKKRGRPPKPKPPVDPNVVIVPKKRGRPPKPKPPVDPNAPPKKRGRPPKPKPEGWVPPVPRPRGRPRKVRPEGEEPPKKKKRGRPPKPRTGETRPASSAKAGGSSNAAKAGGSSDDEESESDESSEEEEDELLETNGTPTKSALHVNGHPRVLSPDSPAPQGGSTTTPQSALTSARDVAKSLKAASKHHTNATPGSSGKQTSTGSKAATTSRKRQRTGDMPSFDDDVFGTSAIDPTDTISTEEFRANERLRKQKEARNFTFEGDASTPRQMRSGRVVTLREGEYGADVETASESAETPRPRAVEDDDDDELRVAGMDVFVQPEERTSDIMPLPAAGRAHVLHMLRILTGKDHARVGEDGEALQGLTSLLNGTVERGEGNSGLLTGPRGAGKTMTVERALAQLPSGSKAPIVVRLSGLAQTDDRRAIREMGRQIAVAEGRSVDDNDEDLDADSDIAPTTLPSHLLALLTQPSPRAIIVIIDEFDLFTEHARQALLYCLLDVVQSVQTGSVETTPRGVAVIGVTSRVDTLLLLEKRVKSRFSHRVWRVSSPLSFDGVGWKALMRRVLKPWHEEAKDEETKTWQDDWSYAVEMLLGHDKVSAALERLAELTTDVRILYRPFILPITSILSEEADFVTVPALAASICTQLDLSGWGTGIPLGGSSNQSTAIQGKLRGLPRPTLGVLVIAKHLYYAGREEFSLAQVEDEYRRFGSLRLAGSGRHRWSLGLIRRGFDHARSLGLIAPAAPQGRAGKGRFTKVRCGISPQDIVTFFRADGGRELGPEMSSWGRMAGAQA